MITDKDGIPVMFRMLPGSIADMSILKAIVTDMQHLGCNSRLILDRGFESAENIAEILNLGIDFTIPSNVTAEPIKKLLSLSIPEMKLTKAWTYHEGHAYKYAEFEVGVITIKDEMKYLIHLPSTHKGAHENNELFNQAKKLKAFVVYDGKKASDDFQNVLKMIHEMELKFENTKVQNPDKTYRNFPAFIRKYLDYTVDKMGLFHLIRKQNAFTFADNRSGMFVMLTSQGTTFEEMMSSYDVRDWVEKAFDVYKTDLEGNRTRTGNPERARGRLFIKYLSLILRIEMQNTLRRHNEDVMRSKKKADSVNGMSVNEVLLSLNTLYAIGNVGDWRLTAVTKNVREIYQVFGLKEPKSGQVILS